MAVAMLSKKKQHKNRSRQHSPGSRAFEEEDEDMVIISRLESEPWQPDLLLERQSDKSPTSLRHHHSMSATTAATTTLSTSATDSIYRTNFRVSSGNPNGADTAQERTIVTCGGFQGVIPVIIKSPSSVITTNTDADAESCAESTFGDPLTKVPGIEEYLQQAHQGQQLLYQQQQEMQLHYQLPAHLQSNSRRQQQPLHSQQKEQHQQLLQQQERLVEEEEADEKEEAADELHPQRQVESRMRQVHEQYEQPYHNSFHGHLGTEVLNMNATEQPQPRMSTSRHRPLSTFEPRASSPTDNKTTIDHELKQEISDVTARDPVYNPDETTIQARALIRRRSIPLLDLFKQEHSSEVQQQPLQQEQHQPSISASLSGSQRSLSHTPIAGMAASSLERLDELAKKVDQLTALAADEPQQPQSSLTSNTTRSTVLREPLDIPATRSFVTPQENQQSVQSQQTHMDPSQVFDSQEYQLACALAAMLACTYRLLNRMQQETRTPQRTESVDSGLDQAARLWKRLSSNSFGVRNPLRHASSASMSSFPAAAQGPSSLLMSNLPRREGAMITSPPPSPETRISQEGATETNSFIKSINKQVRTLKSRRTQSTSHIEVTGNKSSSSLLHGRILGGLGLGSSSKDRHHEDASQTEDAKELEREWAELDKLMDEMAHLWRFVESLEGDNESRTLDAEADPFHDRHQVHVQQQQSYLTTVQQRSFDQQTLDMADMNEDLPQYDDEVPQYKVSEKSDSHAASSTKHSLTTPLSESRLNRGTSQRGTLPRLHSATSTLLSSNTSLDDEKTRFDLNNVMSAIERLSKVAPRMDNQRVQLSPSQKRTLAKASVAHTIERLSRDQTHLANAVVSFSSSSSAQKNGSQLQQQQHQQQQQYQHRQNAERTRDLDKLVNQIVESAAKATSFTSQRVELSPRQKWKLEGARVGDRIERGERLRMSDQDWQSPEKVLLKDMTRLTNALYQQSASSKAFATQRYILTEDKARNMALHGIISKIERVSGRRMENQDALPPSPLLTSKYKPAAPSKTAINTVEHRESDSVSRAKELQEMINQVVESGGGPTRRSAMASQRAQFGPR
ncbi:hypothetical protein EDD11_007180 [Mortierella claussenii]|nr:hypothetical protein EDD11_007180 [Mortierella claussenii]